MIPALRRQKQENLCAFKASPFYILSFRQPGQRNPVLNKGKIKTKKNASSTASYNMLVCLFSYAIMSNDSGNISEHEINTLHRNADQYIHSVPTDPLLMVITLLSTGFTYRMSALVCVVLEIRPRASCIAGIHF